MCVYHVFVRVCAFKDKVKQNLKTTGKFAVFCLLQFTVYPYFALRQEPGLALKTCTLVLVCVCARICVRVCVCGGWGGGWRQKGTLEVLTVEIKEELEKAKHKEAQRGTRERERERRRRRRERELFWIFKSFLLIQLQITESFICQGRIDLTLLDLVCVFKPCIATDGPKAFSSVIEDVFLVCSDTCNSMLLTFFLLLLPWGSHLFNTVLHWCNC